MKKLKCEKSELYEFHDEHNKLQTGIYTILRKINKYK